MRVRRFTTLAFLFLVAAPAAADKRDHREDRDHRGKQPPPHQPITVTGFSPQSGPLGTKVTITGTGFMKQTKVIVGGRPIREDSSGPTSITFTVTERIGNGQIVL